MYDYKKAFLYFDTNALECRHSGKALFLSKFTVNTLYYDIENLIRTMGLTDKVEICIPEVVWFELQEHLVSHFKTEKDLMETKIASFRKSFGDLVEINYTFKNCNTEDEYIDYVASIAKNFIENPRVTAKIIPYPKDEVTIQEIIAQAVHSIKPFRTVRANGKEYTDAGFKDAMIFNTILKHTGNQLGILISNDNDFLELFNGKHRTNLRMCSNVKEVQMILAKEFNVMSDDMIEALLRTDEYLIHRILTETDFNENATYKLIKIKSCIITEDNAQVDFVAYVNGKKYIFSISYNINASELTEANCELLDEGEEQ